MISKLSLITKSFGTKTKLLKNIIKKN